jgi:hypothetical protein
MKAKTIRKNAYSLKHKKRQQYDRGYWLERVIGHILITMISEEERTSEGEVGD